MYGIRTHYLGPTERLGGRIRATAGNGQRLTIGYPHEAGEGEAAHRVAAEALADRLGWRQGGAELAGGAMPASDTYAFVIVPSIPAILDRIAEHLRANPTRRTLDYIAAERSLYADRAVGS